jgi:hypothetical protein
MKTFKFLSRLIIIRPDALLLEAALALAAKLGREAIDGIISGTHHIAKNPPKGIKRKVKPGPEVAEIYPQAGE